MKIALYMRVSTSDGRQTVANQRQPLMQWAKRLGGEIVHEYIDEASGASGNRSSLQNMLNAAHRREFDVLLL